MVARRALIQLGASAIALIVVALLIVDRVRAREEALVVDVEPTVPRAIAVFLMLDSGTTGAAKTGGIAERVKARMRTALGVRVVDGAISPAVDIGQLREVLNVSNSLEVRIGTADSMEVVFRHLDSAPLRRSYSLSAGRSVEDAILSDASKALDPALRTARPANASVVTSDVLIRTRRADSLWKRGDAIAAQRDHIAAISADPQSALARYRYSEFLEARRRTGEALREARRAHELDPLSAEIHLAYARMLERSGRNADAARERQELQRIATILHPTPKDKLARARFKNVPKRPPRSSHRSGAPGRD